MTRIPGPGIGGSVAVALGMARDAPNTLLGLQRRYGNVFRFGRGPMAYTVLCGPDANRFLLSEHPENFTWREAIKGLIVVDGDTALVVTDGPEHDRRRRLVQPAFSTRAIKGYGEIMEEEANRTIDGWRAGDELDLYDEWRRCIRRIAIRTLFGDTLGDRAEEFGDALGEALEYVNRPLSMMFQWHGPAYRRAVRSRDRADAIVNAEIARRRARPATDDDLLDRLLPELSDLEVRDQVVSLIAAGYDTTSGAAGWVMHELLHNDGAWARAAAAVDTPHLDHVVNETLRLWPPGFISARKATQDFSFGGYDIAGGSLVVYSAYVTGRMHDVWTEPDVWNPDRWVDLEVDPYAFVPFGGGYRRCIGFQFATQELKAITAAALRRCEFASLRRDPIAPAGVASMMPKGGVRVRVVSVR
ncbi:MAG TPA: cytochrome P450 [Acidimicrobiales bacterium]|nr:cytochrome P450 [Acidimicrobiales bacterium]